MKREDKSAVLAAAKKLKRSNRNVDDGDSVRDSGKKNFRNENDDEGIADSIINAVRNFTGKD